MNAGLKLGKAEETIDAAQKKIESFLKKYKVAIMYVLFNETRDIEMCLILI